MDGNVHGDGPAASADDRREGETVARISVALREDHDRIARDLHDHVIQELYVVGLGLQALGVREPAVAATLERFLDSIDDVIAELRTTIFRLQPARHDASAVRTRLLAVVDQYAARLGFRPTVRLSGPLDLNVDTELASDIVAVGREALANIVRHADASAVSVSLSFTAGSVVLEITDDGRGLGEPTRSSGLRNMLERAERNGGALVTSIPPGGGTRLTWTATPPIDSGSSSPPMAA